MVTENDLRRLQERKRTELGLGTGGEKPPAVAPLPITAPCRICGQPITVTPLPGRFRPGLPSRFAHRKCLDAEEQQRRQREADNRIRDRECALAAIRADPPTALARCGVPKHWRQAAFDNCPDLPGKLVAAARRWAEDPGGILYLYGIPGSGKSWLAVATLRNVLEAGTYSRTYSEPSCRYIAERDYLAGLRAAFDDGNGEVSPRLLPDSDPRRVRLLLYDDLAAERQTDWTRGEIAGLIEARHADELPTIITANVAPGSIAQAIDGRVASRVAESRMMLEFPRRDLRVKGTARASMP